MQEQRGIQEKERRNQGDEEVSFMESTPWKKDIIIRLKEASLKR